MKVTVSVTFNDENERDRELLRRLRAEPKSRRSATVRQALEEHYLLTATLRDLIRRLEKLLEMTGRRQAAAQRPAGPAADEPADLAAALDQLGT